jgi:hypothetical protein
MYFKFQIVYEIEVIVQIILQLKKFNLLKLSPFDIQTWNLLLKFTVLN